MQLDHLRTCGDPEADDVIRDLFARGDDVVRAINMPMRDLVENNDAPAPSLPPGARACLLATGLPGRADRARIELGQRVFHRSGERATSRAGAPRRRARADEVDACMHTSNVIGALTGPRQELPPRDYAGRRALADRLGERRFATCPEDQAPAPCSR